MIFLSVLLLLVSGMPVSAATPARASGAQASISAPVTRLTLQGEPGDFVLGDRELTFTPADGTFNARVTGITSAGLVDGVSITFSRPDFSPWEVAFSTEHLDTSLVPGIYNRAQRIPFEDVGHPGLSIIGNARGCNTLSGKFIILDAQFDHSGSFPRIISFAAQFEQHCNSGVPGLFGTVFYNYTPTVNISLDHVSITGGGRANGAVAISGVAPPGGVTVELASNNPSLVTVPPTVVIPEGSHLRTFPVQTAAIKALPRVQIVATLSGVSSVAELIVNSPFETTTEFLFRQSPGPSQPGLTILLGGDDAIFNPRLESTESDELAADINSPENLFIAFFSTQQLGIPLRPGFYPDAEGFSPSPGHPGLVVNQVGAICFRTTGEFTILEAIFDDTFSPPLVVSFAADYKRFSCDANTNLLDGHFYYNFSPPQTGLDFDISLQDESNGNLLKINSSTGDYQFTSCRSGVTMRGRGTISLAGGLTVLHHNAADHRVIARIDRGANRGTASVGVFSPQATFTITDRNLSNNSNACP